MRFVVACALAVALAAPPLGAQEEKPVEAKPAARKAAPRRARPARDPQDTSLGVSLVRNLAEDQKAIWTGAFGLRFGDARWLAPLAGATAGLMATDRDVARNLSFSPNRIRRSQDVADIGVAALVGASGALYLWGVARHDDHRRETGLLAMQAAGQAFAVDTLVKVAVGRERPQQGSGNGQFWKGGRSFPSGHAAISWAAASVIAHEYPGPLTQMLAYGAAAAVSAARVTSHDHFPSDVLVGGAMGWLIGRQVYRAHHDPALGGTAWGSFERSPEDRDPEHFASPYVPLDSWVYAAFDRLSALGYVPTGFAGLRPWTRMECARLALEADEMITGEDAPSTQARAFERALAAEFGDEVHLLGGGRNLGVRLDSVYTRWTGISGTPLRDGFHFGQTLYNDFGRPYAEGSNLVTGFTSHALAGPLAFYVSGEYQHAPGDPNPIERPGGTIVADEFGSSVLPPKVPIPGVDRFRVLDAYVVLNLKSWQLSFGRQSLWWGPGSSGGMMFSNNAEPVTMLRVRRSQPAQLPWILGWLGPMQTEFVIGQLGGQHFVFNENGVVGSFNRTLVRQPFVNAQKISFKPTPNLEFGISRSGILGGPDFPITWERIHRHLTATATANGIADAGDRRTGFDFRYRVPGLRNWLVLYNDALSEDDISPLNSPRRSAMNPGIYMPRLPGLPKLDFRAEAAYTDLPGLQHTGFFYWNLRYLDGYTNQGNLMGNWVGRQGRGLFFQSTYWMAPRKTIQVRYRKQGVSPDFLRGGTLHDVSGRADFLLRHDVGLTTSVQYERWSFPLLAPDTRSNVSASVQVTWWPKWAVRR